MHLLAALDPLLAGFGFLVGVLIGVSGVGGGSLTTPFLVLFFGIPPAVAVGTDLVFAALTKTASTLVHGWHGMVDWRVTGRLATGSIPATGATLWALHSGLVGGRAPLVMSGALGAALILTAVALLARERVALLAARVGAPSPRRAAALTVATGALLGTFVTLSSVGAGAFGVTALLVLYPRAKTVRIVGSDIAHAVGVTCVAGLGHFLAGAVDWRLLLALLLGSLPGAAIGSRLAARLPEAVIRPVLAALMVAAGGRLLF